MRQLLTVCLSLHLEGEVPLVGPDLVRLALRTGRPSEARAVTEQVGHSAAVMDVAWAEAATLRCRGLLDADAVPLLEALDLLREGTRPLQQAQTAEEAGALLARSGDVSRAGKVLDGALATYVMLGASRHEARVNQSLRAIGVHRGRRGRRPARPPTGWESLTDAERAVVDLVADGLTNRGIAARLFVSPRTIETHLGHIFAKLGLQARSELIALAVRRSH
jgi:DNA-binding CsgD family transcriptional regulator